MRLLKFILFCSLFLVLSSGFSYAMTSGCSQDCKKCHTLTAEEVKKMFGLLTNTNKSKIPKIVSISNSSIKGLWTVKIIDDSGKTGTILIDYGKKNILAGVIINVSELASVARPAMQSSKVDMSQVPLVEGSIIIGNMNAPKKVVVFTDPDCPYCAAQHKAIERIAAKRKDVAFFLKLYPLPSHPDALRKSKSILCSGSQSASLAMLNNAYNKKEIPSPKCNGKAVDNNIALAKKLNINAVPVMIYNGKMHIGALDEKGIEDFIK